VSKPDMHMVESSNIAELGYDCLSKRLYVRFKNGTMYFYENVPESVYKCLDSAPSIGGYFSANIRYNYSYHKITD
jgi:hypothetical protein